MPWISGRGGSIPCILFIFGLPGSPEVHLGVSPVGGAVDAFKNLRQLMALHRPCVSSSARTTFGVFILSRLLNLTLCTCFVVV